MNDDVVFGNAVVIKILVQAPFAVFRVFSAGSIRPTAAFITPTAAYGLLLNFAGVNTRYDNGRSPMTLMKVDLPTLRIALGVAESADGELKLPAMQSVFQQLHNYPVGGSGKERAATTKGSKYNVTPVRRQFLSGLQAVIALECDPPILETIRASLDGKTVADQFGLPFLGDNSFLPDRVERLGSEVAAHWFEEVGPDSRSVGTLEDVSRLTQWIDRTDMSKTRSALYAPIQTASVEPSEAAWTEVGPPETG